MNKIRIAKISAEVLMHTKDLMSRGASGPRVRICAAQHGADVDKEAYELIREHREKIERISQPRFEESF